MAYPKLIDGDRVYTAGSGNNISSADHNELQDQLRVLLKGTREVSLTLAGVPNTSEWSYDLGNLYWVSSGAGGQSLFFPFPFDCGRTITEIHFTIEVATNGTGGDLELWRRTRTPSGGSMVAAEKVATIDADIWDGLTDATATEMSYTGLSYVMAANYSYWLNIRPRTSIVCKVHEAMAKTDDGS